MNVYAITSLLCGTFCLVLAIFAFITGRNKVYVLLGCYNLAVSLWGFGNFVVGMSNFPEQALFGWKLAHFGGFFLSAFFYHLVATLCEVKRPKIFIYAYMQGIILNLINYATPWMMNLESMRTAFGFFYIDRTFFSTAGFCSYLFIIILSYAELITYIKSVSGDKKAKMLYISFGFLFGFVGGTSVLLSEFRMDFIYPAGNLGVFIYAAIVTYAVLKNKILDVQEIADAFQREKMAVLGTMAASLNHEIKNPLFVVRGKAECYLDGLERGRYASYEQLYEAGKSTVNPILNQVTRALDIIQKFTDFARPFSTKGSRETVILSEVFTDVRELVSSEFQRSEVKLVHNLTNGVFVVANRRHVEEILSNLVINACHAVGESGGQVSVMAESENKKVKIEVSDTGPGISKENLARVFEPFFTTKGPKGSGLGLYITKQLVERNGGKISVKSKLGEGTSFKLEFKR